MKSSDKLAIQELLSRAAYAFDERDMEMLEQCFTKDASMLVDITGVGEVGPFEGRGDIMELMNDTLAVQTDVRRHVVSNFFFESEQKKQGRVISSLIVFSVENGEINVIISGIYRDDVVRKKGRGRIKHRHLELDLPF